MNYYYGRFIKHGSDYPDIKVRLFNRNTATWDDRLVHETLNITPGQPRRLLKGYLLHYSYYYFKEHLAKINQYTTLAAANYFKQGKKAPVYKIIFSPWFTFVQSYIFKRGFLDGMHGFILAIMHAYATFSRYVKLWELYKLK